VRESCGSWKTLEEAENARIAAKEWEE